MEKGGYREAQEARRRPPPPPETDFERLMRGEYKPKGKPISDDFEKLLEREYRRAKPKPKFSGISRAARVFGPIGVILDAVLHPSELDREPDMRPPQRPSRPPETRPRPDPLPKPELFPLPKPERLQPPPRPKPPRIDVPKPKPEPYVGPVFLPQIDKPKIPKPKPTKKPKPAPKPRPMPRAWWLPNLSPKKRAKLIRTGAAIGADFLEGVVTGVFDELRVPSPSPRPVSSPVSSFAPPSPSLPSPAPSTPALPSPLPQLTPLTQPQLRSRDRDDCSCERRPPRPSRKVAKVKQYDRRMSQNSLDNLRRG